MRRRRVVDFNSSTDVINDIQDLLSWLDMYRLVLPLRTDIYQFNAGMVLKPGKVLAMDPTNLPGKGIPSLTREDSQ